MLREGLDHGDFDGLLPRVHCSKCGMAVQTLVEDGDQLVELHAAYHDAAPDDQEAAELRAAFEAPMLAWSRLDSGKSHCGGHVDD